MKSNLTTLKAELLKEFDEKFLDKDPLSQHQFNREVQGMLPAKFAEFLSYALDRAIREAVVGCLPLEAFTTIESTEKAHLRANGWNAARAEMIRRAKDNLGIEIV